MLCLAAYPCVSHIMEYTPPGVGGGGRGRSIIETILLCMAPNFLCEKYGFCICFTES